MTTPENIVQNRFYQTIADCYDEIFPLQSTVVDFVCNRTPAGTAVLDIGCATGSLVIALSKLGYQTKGIDLDKTLIDIAQNKITQQKSPATVQQLDMFSMMNFFDTETFQTVTCFGNTLSHVPKTQLASLFHSIHYLLKPGGSFIGQIIHYERMFQLGLFTLPTIETNHIRFQRTYENFHYNAPFVFKAVLTNKDRRTTLIAKQTLYPLLAEDIETSLRQTEFDHVRFYGSFSEAPVSIKLTPLIFHAIK